MKYYSDRVAQIPPYMFAEIMKKKEQLINSGVKVIDLGMGDPDLPTPMHIVDKLQEELHNHENFKYPNFRGCKEFREAVAFFYKKQFNVDLDPETEVLALIGCKEGIAHLIPTVIDPGEYVLIPDPSYPVYRMATFLANGQYYSMPLLEENEFKPDFSKIPASILKKSRLMFLNYPNNPTTACVDLEFFQEACDFAKENQIILAHDSAYNMVTFDGYKAPSVLQAEGAKDIAVELGSLSKTFNMTGFRIGYIVGNKEVIRALSVYKSNTDTGQFTPIQKAAAHGLTSSYRCVDEYNAIYRERLEQVVDALQSIGIEINGVPKGTYFVWAKVPKGYTSSEFANLVLEKTGVIITPGSAFGPSGEGYFRMAVSVKTELIREAVERIKSSLSL